MDTSQTRVNNVEPRLLNQWPGWSRARCPIICDKNIISHAAYIIVSTSSRKQWLTHWGLVTHICVGEQTNFGSDNGLSPDRRQDIIGTNARIMSTGPVGTNFSEISIEIYIFSFKKMHLKSRLENSGHLELMNHISDMIVIKLCRHILKINWKHTVPYNAQKKLLTLGLNLDTDIPDKYLNSSMPSGNSA